MDYMEDLGYTPETKDGKDLITVVVDRSGSMGAIKDDAEGGLNSFLEEQKKVGSADLTLAEFDTEYNLVHDGINIQEFKGYTLEPRSMTALLDAIGRTAASVKNKQCDGKKIFVVVTDGQENSSQEWNRERVFNTIEEMKNKGWEFVFLAADQGAIDDAVSFGFDKDSSFVYAASAKGANESYQAVNAYSTSLRSKSKEESIKDLDEFIEGSETLKKD